MTAPWICSDEQMQASSTVRLSTVCTCSGNLCSWISVVNGGNWIYESWCVLHYRHFIFCPTASFIEHKFFNDIDIVCAWWVFPFSVVVSWEKSACSLQVFQVDLPACMFELAPQVCCWYSKWTVRRLNLAEMQTIAWKWEPGILRLSIWRAQCMRDREKLE